MENESKEAEGWQRPANSIKWHYFRKGKSLCDKWLFLNDYFNKDVGDSTINCKKCQTKRNKEMR